MHKMSMRNVNIRILLGVENNDVIANMLEVNPSMADIPNYATIRLTSILPYPFTVIDGEKVLLKVSEVVKSLNLKQGDVIADIGAGTGYFTRLFAKAVGPLGKALGLDIEPSMVKHMKEDAQKLGLKNYEARVVKTDDPELKPGSVDVVFMCDTYHHIEDRVNYLKQMSKGLKTDGRVVIVDFYKNSPVGPQDPGHKLAEKVVLEEFRQAGYSLIRSHKILPHQYFLEFGLKGK
ncbi:MAG TPA: class I SAM-dependent methyltransferase [Nitrospirae bacterium]|nr:class I SAM-dependent methyltransferase [Nitrospirota bacterium]